MKADIEAGRPAGGFLWLGRPASTPQGQERERTCAYSEVANYGQEWLDMSRCLKQIDGSCDVCLRDTEAPFYERKEQDDF